MASFNLVNEKWIPCIFADGRRELFGLSETLARAPDIREITHPSPLVTSSLHRLLLVILHRNFGPANLEEWAKLWERGCWDNAVLDAYFDRWREKFYLFHPEHPFYQVQKMEDAEEHPAAILALELASGNNATLFDHSCNEYARQMPPDAAARYLLARHLYSIGFGRNRPFNFADGPLVRGLTVFTLGDNLFQTLALNAIAYNNEQPIPRMDDDKPCWEQDVLPQPDRNGTTPKGYVDYLTWQSRRIHLIPNTEGSSVVGCQIQQNLKLIDGLLDPFKCHVKNQDEGIRPLGLSPQRALWRDSHTLFQHAAGRRPQNFNWLSIARRRCPRTVKKNYSFCAFGFATEPGKAASVILWRHERLPLPVQYLDDESLLEQLRLGLNIAEKAASMLRSHAWFAAKLIIVHDEDKQPNKVQKAEMQDILTHIDIESRYWHRIDTVFRRMLVELPEELENSPETDGYRTLGAWGRHVRNSAEAAFAEAAADLGTTPRCLRAVAKAEKNLGAQLYKIVEEIMEREKEVTNVTTG